MTPLEKAEELFAKYAFLTISDMSDENFNQTKQCALVAVDELIRIAPWGSDIDGEIEDDSKEYYIEVKQQIEKL